MIELCQLCSLPLRIPLLVLLVLGAGVRMANAADLVPAGVEISMQAEVRTVQRDSAGNLIRMMPAGRVAQGTPLFYTVQMRNVSDKPLKDVVVVRALPDHTTYIPNSASGAGAEITVSSDGGTTFVTQQRQCGSTESDAAPRCTHLRWRLRHLLPPGAIVLARFAVVFN